MNRLYADYRITMNQIDCNSAIKREQRRLNDEKHENAIENTMSREEETELYNLKQIHNENLANELDRMKRHKIHDEKMRQQIRESTQELRDLEIKLRAAYVAKGLMAQRMEKEARTAEERRNEEKENERLLKARMSDLEDERRKEEDELKRKLDLRNALQDQIITTNQRKQFLYEEFLKEKTILDEIVKRIYDEHIE